MKTHLICLALGLALATGCTHNKDASPSSGPTPATPTASMGFAALANPNARTAQDTHLFSVATDPLDVVSNDVTPPSSTFNFGNLPSSATYLFQLKNTGNVAINNVQIVSDKANVAVVSPAAIAVLPTDGTSSLTPLIAVQVLHGVGLNGNGAAPTLPPGAFTFTLTATGTGANGASVTSSASVTLNVQVANMEVWATGTDLNGNPIPLEKLAYGIVHPADPDAFIFRPKVVCSFASKVPATGWWATEWCRPAKILAREVIRQVTVKNVGSVDLTIHNLGYSATAIPVAFTISPGESKGVDLAEFTFSPNFIFDGRTIFYADSKNVVFDSSMPASERDGLFYVHISYRELMMH